MQLLAEAENEVHGLKIGEKGITLLTVVCAAFHPFFHRGIFKFATELLRDGFGAEKYFHVLLAELKDPLPPPKQEGIYLATVLKLKSSPQLLEL